MSIVRLEASASMNRDPTATACQRDFFDIALGRIVREMFEMKHSAIVADDMFGRAPPAGVLTPRLIRAHLDANVLDAERAGLDPDRAAELRRIIEEEFTWGIGTMQVRLGEINDTLGSYGR